MIMALPEHLKNLLANKQGQQNQEPDLIGDSQTRPAQEASTQAATPDEIVYPELAVTKAGGGREQLRRERLAAAEKGLKVGDTVYIKCEVMQRHNFEPDRDPSTRW